VWAEEGHQAIVTAIDLIEQRHPKRRGRDEPQMSG
jgi:hypothetical protein